MLKQLTYPAAAPATLEQAKAQLIIDNNLDDDLIEAMLYAATQALQNYTQLQLMQANYAFYSNYAPGVEYLPAGPVIEVTAVKYLDTDNVEQTLDPSKYEVNLIASPAVVKINERPTVSSKSFNVFWIEFTAGFGAIGASEAEQREAIAAQAAAMVSAILLQTASLYENREDVNFKRHELIKASEYLAHPFKRYT